MYEILINDTHYDARHSCIPKVTSQHMTYPHVKYNRQSIRLPNHDYRQPGAYFVTICTLGRQCVLQDEIVHGILTDTWLSLPNRFSDIALDEFVIMPNHIHFVLWLQAEKCGVVGTGLAPDPLAGWGLGQGGSGQGGLGQARPLQQRTWALPEPQTPMMDPSLGDVVGGYKSLVFTVYLNWIKKYSVRDRVAKFWQRNYYEHIIRDERALHAIRRYIRENPVKWALDRDNFSRPNPMPEAQSVQDYLNEIDDL